MYVKSVTTKDKLQNKHQQIKRSVYERKSIPNAVFFSLYFHLLMYHYTSFVDLSVYNLSKLMHRTCLHIKTEYFTRTFRYSFVSHGDIDKWELCFNWEHFRFNSITRTCSVLCLYLPTTREQHATVSWLMPRDLIHATMSLTYLS